MSGLKNMRTRLNWAGGHTQVGRMNEDKLRSLKKALLYSYQSATAILADGRMFRCLINPDMIKNEYDNKYISIPFEDVCLGRLVETVDEETGETIIEEIYDRIGTTTEGIEKIGMKPGDVFTWKENNSSWIVYLQRLEETAYFRAEIRRCKYETEINGKKYKVFATRSQSNNIDWRLKDAKNWNELDYTVTMYITRDENTLNNIHRFDIIELNNMPWEIQYVNTIDSDGIIILYLKEWYQNSIKDKIEEEIKIKEETLPKEEIIDEECLKGGNHEYALNSAQDKNGNLVSFYICTKCDKVLWENEYNDFIQSQSIYIKGPNEVYPYDKATYIIRNAEGGYWELGSQKGKILTQTDKEVNIEITTGRSGNLELKYIRESKEDIVLNITIKSL